MGLPFLRLPPNDSSTIVVRRGRAHFIHRIDGGVMQLIASRTRPGYVALRKFLRDVMPEAAYWASKQVDIANRQSRQLMGALSLEPVSIYIHRRLWQRLMV